MGIVCAKNLFPKKPIIEFYPNKTMCCDVPLHVQKSRGKTAISMDIGAFHAKETVFQCCICGEKYRSEELQQIVPSGCNFGYEVLVYVGKAVFLHSLNDREIIQELWLKNISFSSSEISYLSKKFVSYLAIAHRQSHKMLKKTLNMRGGYILHLDATCEGESPHLMTGLDGISELVLDNVKLPSENTEKIIPFLKKIKENYDDPQALVHDMGKGIMSAVEQVFPGKPDFICHYHFLRDIGKDLFGKENDIIRKHLKNFGIQGLLCKRVTQLKKVIDQCPGLDGSLIKGLENGKIEEWAIEKIPVVVAYSLILWALDGKKKGNGYGFPFDRSYLIFYQRLQILYTECDRLQKIYLRDNFHDNKPFDKICDLLHLTMDDNTLRMTALKMQEKASVFDKRRDAMCIADPEQHYGINDDGGDIDIKAIEVEVKKFRHWLLHGEFFSKDESYQKMINQIDKYWQKLFADPIAVNTSRGKITIQPQRTNNILERFFRDIKRGYRKKSGTNSMSNTLKTMLADTTLVRNLKNQEYLNIILNGKATLEERFAEIDAKIVREELKKSQEDSEKVPPKIKRLVKNSQLPQILAQLLISQKNKYSSKFYAN